MELNKIYNGDCLEVMKDIEGKSIDMILCDLPYGTTQNEWDSVLDLTMLWEHYERVIKENGAIVLTAVQPFTTDLIMSNRKLFRYLIVWNKITPTGHLNANKMPLRVHEDILIFYKKLPVYNPQKTQGHTRKVSTATHKRNSKKSENYGTHGLSSYDSTERFPTSILTIGTDKQKTAIHSTQKPVELFRHLIKTYTNEGDRVLDNCSGSGTTAIACMNTNRNFICIEKDKEYYEKSLERLKSLPIKIFANA